MRHSRKWKKKHDRINVPQVVCYELKKKNCKPDRCIKQVYVPVAVLRGIPLYEEKHLISEKPRAESGKIPLAG